MMNRFRTGAPLVAAVVGVAICAPAASAQTSDANKKKAKGHYETGTTHYNLGRFDEAIVEFTKAFELFPEPVFLYNIAQSYRMKENWERARFFYKRYLSLAPNAPNKADVETRIAEMDSELAKAKAGGGTGTGGTGTGGTGTGGTGTGGTGTGTGGTGTGGTGTGTGTGGTGTGGTGSGTGTGGTGTGGTGTGGTGTGTGGTGVATNGGTGTGIGGGTAIGGGGDGTGIGALAEFERDKPIWLTAAVGPAFVDLGGGPEIPVRFAMNVGGGYLFTRGKVGIGAGGTFGFTPIPYEARAGGEAGTAGLATFAVTGDLLYAVARRLDVRLDLGLGVTWFTGLGEGNPFTSEGQAATGPVPMFVFRAGIGVDFRLGGGLTARFSPLVLSSSSSPDNAAEGIQKVQQIDVLIGIGYSL